MTRFILRLEPGKQERGVRYLRELTNRGRAAWTTDPCLALELEAPAIHAIRRQLWREKKAIAARCETTTVAAELARGETPPHGPDASLEAP